MRKDDLLLKALNKGRIDPSILAHDGHPWITAWNGESFLRLIEYNE
jgi:hypothetical protein